MEGGDRLKLRKNPNPDCNETSWVSHGQPTNTYILMPSPPGHLKTSESCLRVRVGLKVWIYIPAEGLRSGPGSNVKNSGSSSGGKGCRLWRTRSPQEIQCKNPEPETIAQTDVPGVLPNNPSLILPKTHPKHAMPIARSWRSRSRRLR